jgi:hypothetical protein
MKQDRFLMGILIFIGVLVAAALALFFVRKDSQAYGAEDSPEGVIRNYVLALQNQDYPRAYSYLADKDGKPTYDAFHRVFLNGQFNPSTALQVGSIQYITSTESTVSVTVLFAGGGPFSQGWSTPDTASLVKHGGAWKLIYMPYNYWSYDWFQSPQPTALPAKP